MRSLRKVLSLALTLSLLFQQIGFAQIATELNIASHLSRIASSLTVEKFRPAHLRYFSYDIFTNNFKVLLDKGDTEKEQSPVGTVPFQEQTQTLLNYFLVGVTLPDSMFWVNLRPDSEDQIIDQYLEKTDVGRIMLEADLQLKKDTSAMTSPATPEGKEYWDRLYKKAASLYGYDNVTIPTLTRPWIVPGEIIVRESKDSAYIYKATLKVMLEQDYLQGTGYRGQGTAIRHPEPASRRHPEPRRGEGSNNPDSSPSASPQGQNDYSFKDSRSKALNEYSTQLIKELIIPKLTKEVNSAKRYAPLRQVYYSLILSRWFKQKFRGQKTENRGQKNAVIVSEPQASEAISSRIDSKNLTNLISQQPWSKTTYFQAYQKSFSQGEYNLQEPVYTPTGQVIRSYFSGGIQMDGVGSPINNRSGVANPAQFSSERLSKLGDLMEGDSTGRIKVVATSAEQASNSSPLMDKRVLQAKERLDETLTTLNRLSQANDKASAETFSQIREKIKLSGAYNLSSKEGLTELKAYFEYIKDNLDSSPSDILELWIDRVNVFYNLVKPFFSVRDKEAGDTDSPIKAGLKAIEGFLDQESNPPKEIKAPALGVFFNEAGEAVLVSINRFDDPKIGSSIFEYSLKERGGGGDISLIKASFRDGNGDLYVSFFDEDEDIYVFPKGKVGVEASERIPKDQFISKLKALREKLKATAAASPKQASNSSPVTLGGFGKLNQPEALKEAIRLLQQAAGEIEKAFKDLGISAIIDKLKSAEQIDDSSRKELYRQLIKLYGGIISESLVKKVGLDWEKVSEALLKKDWVEKISPTEVRFKREWQAFESRLPEVFGKEHKKIASVLQLSWSLMDSIQYNQLYDTKKVAFSDKDYISITYDLLDKLRKIMFLWKPERAQESVDFLVMYIKLLSDIQSPDAIDEEYAKAMKESNNQPEYTYRLLMEYVKLIRNAEQKSPGSPVSRREKSGLKEDTLFYGSISGEGITSLRNDPLWNNRLMQKILNRYPTHGLVRCLGEMLLSEDQFMLEIRSRLDKDARKIITEKANEITKKDTYFHKSSLVEVIKVNTIGGDDFHQYASMKVPSFFFISQPDFRKKLSEDAYNRARNNIEELYILIKAVEILSHNEDIDILSGPLPDFDPSTTPAVSPEQASNSSPVEDAILPNKQDILERLRNPLPGIIYHAVVSDFASDTDTVVSSITEAYRLNEAARLEGKDLVAFPVIQGAINDETLFVLRNLGINVFDLIFWPESEDLLDTNATLEITLTDHSVMNTKEDKLSLFNQKVVCVIEHHPISDKVKPKEVVYAKVGSTNTLVFERFRTQGLAIPKKLALIMLSAILSDTKNLVVNTTDRDREAVGELKAILNYSDHEQDNLFTTQTHALNTIDVQKPLAKIFNLDNLRYYSAAQGQRRYSFTTFRLAYGEEELFKRLWLQIVGFIQNDMQKHSLDVVFFNITNLNEQGGLSDKPEELYVIGIQDHVLEYMNASEISYQGRFEKIEDLSQGVGVYKLKHKGEVPRKKTVERITNYFSSSPIYSHGRASSAIQSVPETTGGIDGSTSSPSILQQSREPGGIDFRILPMTIQPMGSFSGLNFKLPKLSQADLARMDIEVELAQIQRMASSGILPSGQRVKELIAACIQKQKINAYTDRLLLCLVNIFKLQEQDAVDSSPALREALVMVDAVS